MDLFVGDTFFAGTIGRTDLPGGDYDVLMRSITGVLFPLGDEAIVHPGHGADTTDSARENDQSLSCWSTYLGWRLVSLARRDQFDAPNFQTIARRQASRVDARAIDAGAVGAFEVAHFELTGGQGRQPAMHPRHEGCVHDEVGAG